MFAIFQDILNELKPWAGSKDTEYIIYIIAKISSANIFNIVWKIITNGGQLLNDLKDSVDSLKLKNYYGFGEGIGDIIFTTLLT